MNVWRKVYYLTLNLTLNLPTSDTKIRQSAKLKYCGIELIFIWYNDFFQITYKNHALCQKVDFVQITLIKSENGDREKLQKVVDAQSAVNDSEERA